MAFATISRDPVWLERLAAPIARPAMFFFADWPSGEYRASTHHKSIVIGSDTWIGVGDAAFIDAPQFQRSSALMSFRIGLANLPQDDVDDTVESAAIGRRAILYLGLFDEAWENPVLESVFIGRVISAGDFKHKRLENGDLVTDASIEVSNGRNPRRPLSNHHSSETAAPGDTAWRLLPTVAKQLNWPA